MATMFLFTIYSKTNLPAPTKKANILRPTPTKAFLTFLQVIFLERHLKSGKILNREMPVLESHFFILNKKLLHDYCNCNYRELITNIISKPINFQKSRREC